jgi:hypothetical protein
MNPNALDVAVLDLKSPVFKPRPGWGGRLNKQGAKVINSNRFSFWLAIGMFALSFYSVRQYAAAQASTASIIETATAQPSVAARSSRYIELTPEPGQGSAQFAHLAMEQYLAGEPDIILNEQQRKYSENYLAVRIAKVGVRSDQLLLVDLDLCREAVQKAKILFKDEKLAD